MDIPIRFLLNGFAVFAAAYLLPGVEVDSYPTALIAALVLALVNTFVRPILIILTLPLTIVTLGIFLLILNALLILFVGNVVSGFTVDGLGSALLFSILLTLLNAVLGANRKKDRHERED